MTQPSGKLCDAPSHIGFCMRISPIICFFDGSCLLARTIFYAIKWRSFDKAAERIITERFAFDDPDAESYGSLIKSVKARWIVFIFCVVQSVKLFAFGGIIWSKVPIDWDHQASMDRHLRLVPCLRTVKISAYVLHTWVQEQGQNLPY